MNAFLASLKKGSRRLPSPFLDQHIAIMELDPEQADGLLREPSSHLSEYSLNSNSTLVTSPTSPILQQHGQYRASSITEEDREAGTSQQDELDPNNRAHGLGISYIDSQKRIPISRKSVGSSPTIPGSTNLLLPPTSAEVAGKGYRSVEDDFDEGQEESFRSGSRSLSNQAFTANSDCEPLHNGFSPSQGDFECRLKKRPESGRGSWLAVSILILSIYSTVFSGIWLLIAIIRPRYGQTVSTTGRLPITTVSTLYAAFAKSIELSFVTVFVAFVGQSLSKRARFQPQGVTIAEMSMRSWVVQPGTMISHWESVRYAAATRLGLFTLLVALMAMVYTTASDALVAPVLKFGKTESRVMYGKVSVSFANTDYIMDHCNTPIQQATDPVNYGRTCIQIEHAGQAYHNYLQYLTTWVDKINSRNGSDDLEYRPAPVGMVSTFQIHTFRVRQTSPPTTFSGSESLFLSHV